MTEQPQQSGLNDSFDLGNKIQSLQPGPEESENQAMTAARQVHELLTLDPKTGLKRQEVFQHDLAKAIFELEPDDSLTVYVADLDGFKTVNDTLGHDAGDELLGIVAEAFRQAFVRTSDTTARGSEESDINSIARLGGDEYGVFAVSKADDRAKNKRTTTPEQEASIQADRVSKNLQELIQGTKFEGIRNLGISIGSAQFKATDSTDKTESASSKAEKVFAKADLAMFKVKYDGKINRLTDTDRRRLRVIIPYLESIGTRVEDWLRTAIEEPPAAA